MSFVSELEQTIEGEPLGHLFEDALRLLGLLEQLGNLREGGDFDAQLLVEQQSQLIDHIQVARIGHSDLEHPVFGVHRHEVVTEHQIDGDGAEQVVVDRGFAQIDVLAAVARRNGLRIGGFGGRVQELNAFSGHKLTGRRNSAYS